MEVALRKKRYGGWWGGLGDEGTDDPEAGFGTSEGGIIDSGAGLPSPAYNIIPTGGDDTLSQLLASGAGKSDVGAPSTLPSSAAIANAIASFAQIGVKALSPSPVTGACPAGYTLSGAACIPVPGASALGAPLIAGVPNSTLLIIGGGFLFLMMLSKGGGRRR